MSSNFAPTPPPQVPFADVQPADFKKIGQQFGDGVKSAGIEDAIGPKVLRWLTVWAAQFVSCVLHAVGAIIVFFGRIVIRGENQAEDIMAEVARTMVSDLIGSDVSAEALKRRRGQGQRNPQLNDIGSIVLAGIFDGFNDQGERSLEPSDTAARKAISTVVGMTVEGVMEGAIIDSLSLGFLKPLTDLDDNLARSLGFGRLTTRVLRPAVDVLIARPYTMKLNKQYRPTQLTTAQLCRLFNRGVITRPDLDEALAREGYSARNIQALIDETTPNLSVSDIAFLQRNDYWTRDMAIAELRNQGYTTEIASTVLEIERVKRIDAAKQDLVSAATTAYVDRDIDKDAFIRTLDAVGMEQEVRAFAIQAAGLRREYHIKKLSEGDAENAVKRAFMTFREYTDFLADLGYSQKSILIKQLLIQDQIKADVDAQRKRDALEKQRAADRAARDARARQRELELQQKRSTAELTLSQVAQATVKGKLTLQQYEDFLRRQHYSQEDVQLLSDLVSGDRDDYLSAQTRRDAADRKLAVTALSTSQLERAVEVSAITIGDYQSILAQEGVTSEDIDILVKILRTNLEERAAAKAKREEVKTNLAAKDISLAQFERAVRAGLRTMAEYRQFIATAGYDTEEQDILAGLLQDDIDSARAAEQKRQQAEVAAMKRKISLADLETAIRQNLRPMSEYRTALQSLGYSTADVETLVGLLQGKIDDEADAKARKQQLDARLAAKHISLSDLERAAALGIIGVDRYRAALQRESVAPEDQDILVGLLLTKINDIATARAAEAQAKVALQAKPVPLDALKRGVILGIRPFDDYAAALLAAGFEQNAVNLMVQLAKEDKLQYEHATLRRDELARSGDTRELSRADLERAIKAGVRPFEDYDLFLRQAGYDDLDRATLEQLLSDALG